MSMSAHQPLPLSPDLEEAERHLMLLDEGCETWIFQVFDDDKRRKDKALARVLIGTLEEHVAELTRLNRLGAGIFVTVNRMAGAKRGNAQVVGLRALEQLAVRFRRGTFLLEARQLERVEEPAND